MDAENLFASLRAPTATGFLSLKLTDLAAAEVEINNRALDEGCVTICLKRTGQVVGDRFGVGQERRRKTGPPRSAGTSIPSSVAKDMRSKPQGPCSTTCSCKGILPGYAYVEDRNTPSQRLCEKLGMRREGVFVEFVSFTRDEHGNPIYENTMQYAILSREWMSRCSSNLKKRLSLPARRR